MNLLKISGRLSNRLWFFSSTHVMHNPVYFAPALYFLVGYMFTRLRVLIFVEGIRRCGSSYDENLDHERNALHVCSFKVF